ncbi:hypothetical protein [Actinomadura rupiterrae]|uniref:hypothetical protein n=1 Tax=Actinomadura rupiterrae TaxID=559627 RepID=UPI0020A2E301|nr:hypothetical protein [Actinomadura rupiterrae]MCP2343224.1 hypothetical protein [Actinomadura rupiterrae]
MQSLRKTAAVGVAAVAAVSVAGVAAAQADEKAKPATASITGRADFVLPYVKDADVRSFEFNVQGAPWTKPLPYPHMERGLPTDARGTVTVRHYSAAGKHTYWAVGEVDCLVTGPHTASVTALMRKVDPALPGAKQLIGKRVGFSVYDGGKRGDRVGLSWDAMNFWNGKPGGMGENPVGTCMAPAPFAPVTKGGYTVRHAELEAFKF